MKNLFSLFLFATLTTSGFAQNNDQATSPDGAYKIQKTTTGTWAVFDNSTGQPLSAVTPRLQKYDKIVTRWAPDSQKIAVLAMTLKTSDIYIIGTKNAYTVPMPPLKALKDAALPQANFKYNPQTYSFHDNGAVSVEWLSPEELKIKTEFRADLSDTQLGRQDHWQFIISYAFDLVDQTAPTTFQVLNVRQE